MIFEDCYFGYAEGGVAASECYEGVPDWWALPAVPAKVRLKDMEINFKGFTVPWAMFVDEEYTFWLNGNYSLYREPNARAQMEVARTQDGYFVGVSNCLERTWSPYGGYSDPFVPLLVLNLRAS